MSGGSEMEKKGRATLRERFESKVDRSRGADACHLWLGSRGGSRGYGRIGKGGKVVRAHRVAWELEHGPIEGDLNVLHNCPDGDNPTCVNPRHLFLGTQKDNVHDMHAKGRGNPRRGDQHHNHVPALHERSDEIRRRVRAGETKASVARDLGVSRMSIKRVMDRV